MKEDNVFSLNRGTLWIWGNRLKSQTGQKFFKIGTNAKIFGHYNSENWYDVPVNVIKPEGNHFGWIMRHDGRDLILTFSQKSVYFYDTTDDAPIDFK